MINETSFYAILPDAPEWDDLPLATDPVSDDNELRTDALRDSFKSFQDGPSFNLHRSMMTGNATPSMLRDAVRRLSNMLEVSGEVGDYRTEAEIVRTLTNLTMVAQKTIYE
ncbi:hypothetical protein [Burkholderia cenocepacia]|jgi:hypothetical protein|uniref:Hypothetical phage protein n=1 Tax=Burkholderia cenocepacia (strain ATCC BAA-245 / DSM 16553 / LMG 16656 / NCTC 13227 / J2315 / CF5610) TaxID=216591 RepID=B4EME4_BURCJ|nr:hypothetical protein [Burkholderia cenocepacia]KIS52584.1 hypothetical protein NP88_1417 [Burkholderia cepacia]KKI83318.1 hypothetical protein WQ49_05100 [Burkholderia cenocepacia]MBR8027057.1 hypothetical protein [Burkholderia cenocepacia]MBR8169336.1 hypothetical protein [Burkholderia cenocepacia]MBR8480555.1 hypothetical protein [Burkholderia cenocepacia]